MFRTAYKGFLHPEFLQPRVLTSWVLTARRPLACETSRSPLSSPLGTFHEEEHLRLSGRFHTDDVNQCLHNTSGSHGIPNANLFSFSFLLVNFGKVLCSSANELKKNSNASSREDYIISTKLILMVC